MGKGFLAVGFPDSSLVEAETELSDRVEDDKAKLRQLIYSCDKPVVIPQSPQIESRQPPQNKSRWPPPSESRQPSQNKSGWPLPSESRQPSQNKSRQLSRRNNGNISAVQYYSINSV